MMTFDYKWDGMCTVHMEIVSFMPYFITFDKNICFLKGSVHIPPRVIFLNYFFLGCSLK